MRTALTTFLPPGVPEALKGLSPPDPKAGAAPLPPPKTKGCPAGASVGAAAAGAAPKENRPPAGAGAGAAPPKLKVGVAENAGGAAAGVAAPKAGAAGAVAPPPKTEPAPKAGADAAPKVGVEPKVELVEGAPKPEKVGAAVSGFGGAAVEAPKEKSPLLDSAAGFDPASPPVAPAPPPKLNTGCVGA